MQTENPRHWILIVAVLFVAPVLAGCFGDDAPTPGDEDPDGVEVRKNKEGGSDDGGSKISNNTDHSGAKNEPSAHFHHYWGDPPADSVLIYDGAVPFRNYDNKHYQQHNTLAWAQFGLEHDADDVPGDSTDPVNLDSGVADTVFAGTNRIEVRFPDNFPPGVSEMRFQYRPANSPIFLPESGGIQVIPGATQEIHLNEVGMTDPPHQFTTSRWEFRLFASSSLCSQFGLEGRTCPPTVINQAPEPDGPTHYSWGKRGDGLLMIAHNGGQKALDPPHPDFWKEDDVIDLGDDSGHVADPVVLTPLFRERVNQLNDISMPANKIVPLGTEHVEVRVRWDNQAQTQEAGDTFLKLYYHGADTIEYARPTEYDGQDGDWHVYRIYDDDGSKVDPPYESNSFWRFKLVPTMMVGDGEQENMGVFQGDWWIEFKAHKKDNFVLT